MHLLYVLLPAALCCESVAVLSRLEGPQRKYIPEVGIFGALMFFLVIAVKESTIDIDYHERLRESLLHRNRSDEARYIAAASSYGVCGVLWWLVCSIPYFFYVGFRLASLGLLASALLLGLTSALIIEATIDRSGRDTSPLRGWLGKTMGSVVGLAMGVVQAYWFSVPFWWGILAGLIYPKLLVRDAERGREFLLKRAKAAGDI